MTEVTLLEEVVADTPHGDRLRGCMQCGSCGGSCPNGAEMDHTPRALFAMLFAGQRDEVLSSNTMWQCVSCYSCTTRCPREIPITDLMYTLKRMAVGAGVARHSDAIALARVFTNMVERYGRSFEFGIATRYLLLHHPVAALKNAGLGLKMYGHGRMSLRPTRIESLDELHAIVDEARTIEFAERNPGGVTW
ncbi:MAG: 4Fe-4S dicluster domain-containing protein [Planctomycetes bacterium]|nr:4Fe-4S dicluster domain-containing protein [Planctomycetota bacterium]